MTHPFSEIVPGRDFLRVVLSVTSHFDDCAITIERRESGHTVIRYNDHRSARNCSGGDLTLDPGRLQCFTKAIRYFEQAWEER